MKKLLIMCILIGITILISGCANEKPSTQDLMSENDEVRLNAEIELDEMGDKGKTEYFISLFDDDNIEIQMYAKKSIIEIGEPAIPYLIQALKSDNPEFSLEFLSSDKQKKVSETLSSFGSLAVEPLIQALNDKNENLRYSSVRVLSMIEDKRAVEPLIQLMLNDDQIEIRYEVARSICVYEDERTVEPLIKVLVDDENRVRLGAISSLGEIGDKRAVEPLIKALENENSVIRAIAAQSLGEIGDERAVWPLTIALKDENKNVRDVAISALDKIKT